MRVHSLFLKDFRNYSELRLELGPEMNSIFGLNAQGKTNILEALYILSLGRSFRTSRLTEAIRFGSSHFFIEAVFSQNQVFHTLSIQVDKRGKKILFDGAPITKLSALVGLFPVILFSVKDTTIIEGSPAERRRFLDLLLAQASEKYTGQIALYHKALDQRNAAIKTQDYKTIAAWNSPLIAYGSLVALLRYECAKKLHKIFQNLWDNTLKETLSLRYESSLITTESPTLNDIASNYYEQLRLANTKDFELGYTTVGPHRDELIITLNDLPVSKFSSEGQKHSLLAVLRFAECVYLQEEFLIHPLLCMDDIHACLDQNRLDQLFQLSTSLGQTVTTSTICPNHLDSNSSIFHVTQAQVSLVTSNFL
ncbi:DNA replication and repair protein RecF [Chlamydia muridarum str. Nigg]|jgi:recF protein|uniref:DNA replication and repair protein RecF n=2 Tax=Chlamydia muridarum TaxID=83560 RepID=RECF_CHLMU|nr:DNA replication/repair protein RecF [Chlamydia muridarum]Q9PKW5.1 RecName: Full=DNA replication and repair protein RecF [Chlamydia muridarum str. Nigg]AAF39207.1 recF protein, putative [Chlamydia muridarum str. Nigg]AHH22737.1 recombinase RecF [Chlamydia muridarum str. Nigg3 CMUT3-5]AHH23662.1 recombinase RecF [Chlamydia muridarum str. Nigg CM972]AID37877.1 recombinase RecF [Chlamydia muridarum str. Nigg 2 MCR]AIT90545.1 recombinase RecF [Chlamydia muridarum]